MHRRSRGWVRIWVGVVACWLVARAASAEIVIDTLLSAQSGTSSLNTAEALGGERDLEQVAEQNTATVGSRTMSCVGSGLFNGCVLEYDGDDDDPVDTDPVGFAPVDVTADGNEEIAMTTVRTAGTCSLLVRLCDTSLCDLQSTLMASGAGRVAWPLTDFPTVDLTAIVGVLIAISPQSVPASCAIGPPRLRKTPLFEDGFESGGLAAWSGATP